MWFDFRWHDWNLGTIAKHGITPEECQWVVNQYRPYRSGDNRIARGQTRRGRWIEVGYTIDEDGTVFVFHAMDLKPKQRRKRK